MTCLRSDECGQHGAGHKLSAFEAIVAEVSPSAWAPSTDAASVYAWPSGTRAVLIQTVVHVNISSHPACNRQGCSCDLYTCKLSSSHKSMSKDLTVKNVSSTSSSLTLPLQPERGELRIGRWSHSPHGYCHKDYIVDGGWRRLLPQLGWEPPRGPRRLSRLLRPSAIRFSGPSEEAVVFVQIQ